MGGGGVVFGAALLLYVATAAPDAVGHDAGELQFVPYILGIAHHTGYPLYTLLGKLWTPDAYWYAQRAERLNHTVQFEYPLSNLGRVLSEADQDGHPWGEMAVIGEVSVK